MSHKSREQRRRERAGGEGAIRWAAVLRSVVLGGSAALVVIGALVPSESAIPDGAFAPMIAGWCLLLVLWAASLWLDERRTVLIGWTEIAGTAFVGWHSVAALAALGETNGRYALNAHWVVLSFGLAAFLWRQTVRTGPEARSLVACMVWLTTLLAALGLFQYGYSMPKVRAAYERDPVSILEENGIPTEENSTQRKLFENRIQSKEPLATFALTNSLAGVLAPWLVAALAIGVTHLRERDQRRSVVALALAALVIAACLVLTKSRTGYLATLGGLVLLGLHAGRRRLWRIDWRIPAGLAGAAIVIGLAAVYFGGLDVQVVSEAPKAVRYRVEYWQATARIIADYPLFGCGPGNFQEAFALHKLPQASETVKDPHNLFLEIWATAGTPAIALFLLLLVAFAVDHSIAAQRPRASERSADETPVAPAIWIVFGGAGVGLLLGPWIAAALGFGNEQMTPIGVILLLGAGLLAATVWALDGWIALGRMSLAAAVIPQVVLLLNLLAAGSLVFPTVMATFLVLMPVALFIAAQSKAADPGIANDSERSAAAVGLSLPRAAAGGVALSAVAVALACLYTEYYPVMNSQLGLSRAMFHLRQGRLAEAQQDLFQAARADSLAPEPWQMLSQMRLEQWLVTNKVQDWETFVETADTYRRLDPRNHVAWYARGNWFLMAWKKSGRPEDLAEALAAYRTARDRFPNRALYHAQVAWTLHLTGDEPAAREAADRAHELDEKMLHREQKLSHHHVADPDLTKKPPTTFREESAEQTVEQLRNATAEEKQ
jgi:hypothetical protein